MIEWVEKVRENLKAILTKVTKDITTSFKESAAELLCEELEKIPIPFVGKVLSSTVKHAFDLEETFNGEVDKVFKLLQEMQLSDDNFRNGLNEILIKMGDNFDHFDQRVITAIMEIKCPELKICDLEKNFIYPVLPNELRFGLMNVRGGAVKVSEIELKVESWEPVIKFDFSVPAAPPSFLLLKVTFSTKNDYYPLLKLNNETYRVFGSRSEGAEDVRITMFSRENARYRFRIHIPHKDVDTEEEKTLIYPPLDKDPLEVAFWFAPAWNEDISPETLLERKKILSGIETTLQSISTILQDIMPSDRLVTFEKTYQKIKEIGIHMKNNELQGLFSNLHAFNPSIARIAQLENSPDIIKAILRLAHQLMRHNFLDPNYGPPPVNVLSDIFNRPELADDILAFFSEKDESNRDKIFNKIIPQI